LLKKNLIASYGTQAYVSLIGLVVMPFYLRHMGADAFGLIGIFWFLQSALQLFDLGLTPTVSRQMSWFRAGAASVVEADLALTGTAWLFAAISVVFVVAFACARPWIGAHCAGGPRLPAGVARAGLSWTAPAEGVLGRGGQRDRRAA